MYTYVDDMAGLETFGELIAIAFMFLIAMAAIGIILGLAIATVSIVANYKLFERAGLPGWKQFIPIYADWYRAKIGLGPGYEYIGLIPWVCVVLQVIPYIGWVFYFLAFIQYWYLVYKYAQSFGAGPILQLITALFGVIGEAIIAFSQGFGYLGYWGQALGLPRMNIQNPGYADQYNNEYNNEQYYSPYQNNAESVQNNQQVYEQPNNLGDAPANEQSKSSDSCENTKINLQKDDKSRDIQINDNKE